MLNRKRGTRSRGSKIAISVAVAGSLFAIFADAHAARAAAPKDECVEAHSRGQDQREKGQLTRARSTFLACAQSSCPALIQGDCARFGEELDRLVPSVSFGARDARSGDLPGTSVFVDDVLMATRLDDGKSYDLDPGKHVIRFVHDGKDSTLRVVLNQGEKGRTLVATFADINAQTKEVAEPVVQQPKRPALPLVVAGLGAAGLATGVVLMAIGLHDVPSQCSVSTRDCAAPPGDKAFEEANHGVNMANMGLGVGLAGTAVLAGSLIWYFTQPLTPPTQSARASLVTPWVGQGSGGMSFQGAF